jgi:hydrogenase expression/formation protein HypC
MCIAIPLRVTSVKPGRAVCEGRGEVREVETALVGECAVGDWLLVFIDSARERITPARADEVNAALDLLQAAFRGDAAAAGNFHFALPSAMSADQLAELSGATAAHHEH